MDVYSQQPKMNIRIQAYPSSDMTALQLLRKGDDASYDHIMTIAIDDLKCICMVGLVDLVESSNTLEDTFAQAMDEFRDAATANNDMQ